MPSVAVVCATFTFEDAVADMSDLLRTDFETKMEDVRIVVHGRFGKLRARIPWSRPKKHGMSALMCDALTGKRRAVQGLVLQREAECARWFYTKFEGRFAAADPEARPSIRLMFTQNAVPFEVRRAWLEPAGLDWAPDVYRCVDTQGWALKASNWPRTDHRYAWTIAARRSDVGREGASDATGRSNWSMTQSFGTDQAPLVARYALTALLDIYAGQLARLRDAGSQSSYSPTGARRLKPRSVPRDRWPRRRHDHRRHRKPDQGPNNFPMGSPGVHRGSRGTPRRLEETGAG
jgi:hypothetical protein